MATESINLDAAAQFGSYSITVDESELDGASQAIACTSFPLNVMPYAVSVKINELFAGQTDAAMTVGDTADGDYLVTSLDLDAIAAVGLADITIGSGALPCYEADWDGDGLDLTFSATDLGNLTTGNVTVTIYFQVPEGR